MSADPKIADKLLASAKNLIPLLRSAGSEIAESRSIPIEVLQSLIDSGLMQCLRPALFDGREIDFYTVMQIARTLAEGDGSVAWFYSAIQVNDHLVGHMSEVIQSEYWCSERPLCSSSYVPTGNVEIVEDGYLLSGKWSFCTGVDHCDWIILGGVPKEQHASSQPDLQFFLVSTKDLEIQDDWYVGGLAGTGSKSVIADGLFVPKERVLSNQKLQAGDTPGMHCHDNPLYRAPTWPLLGFAILAPVTGIVRGAYHALLASVRGKLESGETHLASRVGQLQMRIAEVSVALDVSERLYDDSLAETCQIIDKGEALGDELRARNRRNQVFVAKSCRQALETMMQMAGTRGLQDERNIHRAMRDLYGISAHPSGNWDNAMVSYGSVLLGGKPTEIFC